jgi:hypothetical protein
VRSKDLVVGGLVLAGGPIPPRDNLLCLSSVCNARAYLARQAASPSFGAPTTPIPPGFDPSDSLLTQVSLTCRVVHMDAPKRHPCADVTRETGGQREGGERKGSPEAPLDYLLLERCWGGLENGGLGWVGTIPWRGVKGKSNNVEIRKDLG